MIDLGHYLIDADDRSVTLYRRRVSEKGEATTVVVGYYANLTAVARKLATLPTHEAIAARKTVTEIALIVDRATATILEARHAQPALYTDAQLTEWAASKNPRWRALAAANRRAPR